MRLLKLFRDKNRRLEQLSFSEITPEELKLSHDLNTISYMTVDYIPHDAEDDTPVVKTVNLSLLLTETIIGKLNTWAEVVTELTEVMVESYESASLDIEKPVKYVGHISGLNNDHLDLHYTSMDSPDFRDVPSMMWKLTDLCITQRAKVPEDEKLDFSKCLCSINGLVSKPIVHKDELFVPDGMKFMLDSTEIRWPDVVLLNFETLADFTIVPFSDCTHKVLRPGGAKVDGCDIELTLPDTDLTNKSVMAVVGHTLILHDQIFVTGKNTIHVAPYRYPLNVNLLMKKKLSQDYIPNTDLYRTYEDNLKNYIYTDMFDKDHHGAFFIVIDTPNLFIAPMNIAPESSGRELRTKDPLGIVRMQANWGIVDYVYTEYNNITIINPNESPHLMLLDGPFLEEQIGMDYFNCLHNTTITDIYNSPFEMFRILA